MIERQIFYRGLAKGPAFCNRVEELDRLTKNIHQLTHTLLISPRRYGKTSLAYQAIERTKLPCAFIDLFMKFEAESLMLEFYSGIAELMSTIAKPSEKMISKIESLLKNLIVSVKVGKMGFEFSLAPKKNDRNNLKYLFQGVDEFLENHRQHAIIFIDEMQTITQTDLHDEIESSLRLVAQKTKNITFIFSGSSRHLLSQIFEDRSRPLYKLCHIMPLERISANAYQIFINKFAKQVWKQPLSNETLDKIFYFTKRHPYYLNILCSYLFEQIKLPTEEDVDRWWEKVCQEEQGSIAKELEFLTTKQKQLISEIAKHPGITEPTGKNFLKLVNLTPKGVSDAIKIFLKHDLIEISSSHEIQVVDPVLEYWAKVK